MGSELTSYPGHVGGLGTRLEQLSARLMYEDVNSVMKLVSFYLFFFPLSTAIERHSGELHTFA